MAQQSYNIIWTEDGWIIKPLGYNGDNYMFPPYNNIGRAKEDLARFITEPVTLYTHGKWGRVTKKEVLEPYVCYKRGIDEILHKY